jgi:hypothetical protein
MKELVFALMLWIGEQTGFPIPEPPIISTKTTKEFINLIYDCDNLKKKDKALYDSVCVPIDSTAREILALYNHITKEIYLPSYFNKNNIGHKAILLHELVHHMQYLSGYNKKVFCRPMLEKQAYDLTDLWLVKNNAVMPKNLKIGPILRFTITTCKVL